MRTTLLLTFLFVCLIPSLASGQWFADAVHYSAIGNPAGICSADFDGDGVLDLAVVPQAGNTVNIFMGDGDGTFTAGTAYAAGTGPLSVCAANLDGDSDQDLAVANWTANTISIFKGNGNGTFMAAVHYAAGTGPRCIVAADLNNDSDIDLAVACESQPCAGVYINNGNATFQAAVNYATGDGPLGVVAFDYTDDGYADLITGNSESNTISKLVNNGNGTFATQVTEAVLAKPGAVCAVDINGDVDKDLMAACFLGDFVAQCLNPGFAIDTYYPTGDCPISIVGADLDNDGDNDVVTANQNSNDLSLLENDGGIQTAVSLPGQTGTHTVCTGDFDDDGDIDLAATNQGGNSFSVFLNNTIATAVDDFPGDGMLPNRISLRQNYPNPFNPSTMIDFSLPRRSRVIIEIHNIMGQVVRRLVDREFSVGIHEVEFDGCDNDGNHLATGIYLYRLKTPDYTESKKMLLVK